MATGTPRPRRPGTVRAVAEQVTSGGASVAYELSGSGPALVLLHGITESRRSWEPLVPRLAEGHRVLALDLPGHGESGSAASYDVAAMAVAVTEVAAAVGLERPVLIGHSLGGMVATAAATATECWGVVNVDQPLDLAGFQAGLADLEPALRGDDATFHGAIRAVFDAMVGPLPEPERARIEALRRGRQEVVLAIWAPVLESTPGELEAQVRAVGAAVQVPYLSLHGIDPGIEYATWLAGIIPTAVTEVWPDHGHYPHLVDPDRFLERLATFEATLG
jgi:pimeloyl-ACP methyl ester carboxylesterase